MQRDKNTCVFSSFALALHSTGNANLQKLAQRLHAAGTQHEGEGCVNSLRHVQVLVQQHCKWLQLVRMRSSFDWQESIGEGDFFLSVIRDSSSSTQHAVTLHGGWIFDSNEPWALPLSKKILTVVHGVWSKVQFRSIPNLLVLQKDSSSLITEKNIDDISLMSLGHTYA
jgi:hypothetical protein